MNEKINLILNSEEGRQLMIKLKVSYPNNKIKAIINDEGDISFIIIIDNKVTFETQMELAKLIDVYIPAEIEIMSTAQIEQNLTESIAFSRIWSKGVFIDERVS